MGKELNDLTYEAAKSQLDEIVVRLEDKDLVVKLNDYLNIKIEKAKIYANQIYRIYFLIF